MIRRLLRALKTCVPLVVAFFVGRLIYVNWQQVRAEAWQLDFGLLALSFVLAAPWYLVRALGWTRLIRSFGHEIGYWDIFRVYRQSEMSRYVPGGIWQFASRVYLTRRYGVGPATCLAATMLDLSLAILAALVPAAGLAATSSTPLEPWQQYVMAAFAAVGSLLVQPRVFNAVAQQAARRLGQPFRPLRIKTLRILEIWALYVAAFALFALALACFARALLPSITAGQIVFVAGCYAIAWVTALLTMVAPAGMGVREGLLGILLAGITAVGTAMTLAVAIRLWTVAMELAWLLAALRAPSSDRRAAG